MSKNLGPSNFCNWEIKKGGRNNSAFSRIGSLEEIRSPVLNLRKFWKTETILTSKLRLPRVIIIPKAKMQI